MQTLLKLDRLLFLRVNGLARPELDWLFGWPTFFGSLWAVTPLVLAGLLIFKRKELVRWSFLMLIPLFVNYGIIEALKVFFARPRPYDFFQTSAQHVRVLFSHPDNLSFPSGHSATAFLAAVLGTGLFGKRFSWLYLPACLIAFSRLYVGVHYPSDVLGGALFGLGFGFLFLWGYRRFGLVTT